MLSMVVAMAAPCDAAPGFKTAAERNADLRQVAERMGGDHRVSITVTGRPAAQFITYDFGFGWRYKLTDAAHQLLIQEEYLLNKFPGGLSGGMEARFDRFVAIDADGHIGGDGFRVITREEARQALHASEVLYKLEVLGLNLPAELRSPTSEAAAPAGVSPNYELLKGRAPSAQPQRAADAAESGLSPLSSAILNARNTQDAVRRAAKSDSAARPADPLQTEPTAATSDAVVPALHTESAPDPPGFLSTQVPAQRAPGSPAARTADAATDRTADSKTSRAVPEHLAKNSGAGAKRAVSPAKNSAKATVRARATPAAPTPAAHNANAEAIRAAPSSAKAASAAPQQRNAVASVKRQDAGKRQAIPAEVTPTQTTAKHTGPGALPSRTMRAAATPAAASKPPSATHSTVTPSASRPAVRAARPTAAPTNRTPIASAAKSRSAARAAGVARGVPSASRSGTGNTTQPQVQPVRPVRTASRTAARLAGRRRSTLAATAPLKLQKASVEDRMRQLGIDPTPPPAYRSQDPDRAKVGPVFHTSQDDLARLRRTEGS